MFYVYDAYHRRPIQRYICSFENSKAVIRLSACIHKRSLFLLHFNRTLKKCYFQFFDDYNDNETTV